MESASMAYQRYMNQNVQQSQLDILRKKIQNDEILKKEYLQDFENIFLPNDLAVLCDLLDHGYSMREIMDAYTSQNYFAKEFFMDQKLINQYEDKVLGLVNQERQKRVSMEYEKAKDIYLTYLKSSQHKYSHGEDSYAAYHEGEIVLALMQQHGFAAETIHTVLQTVSDHDSAYIKTLLEKCGHVKQAYVDIQNAGSLDDARNEFDVFRSFAKSYMERMGIKLLSFDDEFRIVKEMRAEKFPDEFLKPALLKASPVAMEPGRNSDQYVQSLLSNETGHAKENFIATGAFINATDVYMDLMEKYQDQLVKAGKIAGINNTNRMYYDCLAVRELLQRHLSENDIMQALKDKSPEAAELQYSIWIIEKAKKLLKKEQNLLQEVKIPAEKSYRALIDDGVSPSMIYQSILQKRRQLNPSLSQKLYAAFVDKDIAEACLKQYPDFDKEALLGIMQDSPRAIVLSGTRMTEENEYAANVVREAEGRLTAVNHREEQERSVFMEFNRQRGLAYQGVEAKNAMPLFQWGRSALQMLLQGYDLLTIRHAIIAAAEPLEQSPAIFADTILDKIPTVYDRLMQIKNYTLIEQPRNADDYYRNELYFQYQKRKVIKSSVDVYAVKRMLATNNYSGEEMRKAITAFSPIAVEPGRDDQYYTKYVLPNAKGQYLAEKEKLKYYRPIPRLEHEVIAPLEYQYHRKQMEEVIDLPYNTQMDVLIAETMLVQGFSEADISQVLETESPCRDQQKYYGISLVNRAKQLSVSDQLEVHTQDHVRVRALLPDNENEGSGI